MQYQKEHTCKCLQGPHHMSPHVPLVFALSRSHPWCMTVAMATSDADDVKLQASSSNIDIFLRVKPVPKQSTRLLIDAAENNVEFNIPRDLAAGYGAQQQLCNWLMFVLTVMLLNCRPINNTREHYKFQFNGVLTPEAKQDEVPYYARLQRFTSMYCHKVQHMSLYTTLIRRALSPLA